jgi:hypothetical protein
MWRFHITEHSPVATRLTMIFQHGSRARKPKLNHIINLKGAKSLWWCWRSGVLFYSELTPSATRRDGDDAIIIFRINRI